MPYRNIFKIVCKSFGINFSFYKKSSWEPGNKWVRCFNLYRTEAAIYSIAFLHSEETNKEYWNVLNKEEHWYDTD